MYASSIRADSAEPSLLKNKTVPNSHVLAHSVNQMRVLFNLFTPNGISHRYQMGNSISNFRVVGLFFQK